LQDYCKTLLVCSTLLVTPVVAKETVSLSCVWTVYDHNFESFFIDLSSKKVLWVEEETEHEISEFTQGFIKFNGIKSAMQGASGIRLEDVAVNFKINRINGNLDVIFNKGEADIGGSCEISQVF